MSSLFETTETYERNLLDFIENKYQPILILLDKLKTLLKTKKISVNIDEECVLKNVFTSYDVNTLTSFDKLNSLYKELRDIVEALNPIIRWLPETDKNATYIYYMGNSPWSFILMHENGKATITKIQEEILLEYKRGELDAFSGEAKVGDTVFFMKMNKLNRGLITSIEEEIYGITNIDNGHNLFCEKDELFYPTMNVQLNAAQSIHCCLICSPGFDESIWCDELKSLFISVLAESKLKLAHTQKDNSVPPKFITRLIGINDKVEVDLTEWFEKEILTPWMLEGKPSGISATKFFAKKYDPYKNRSQIKIPGFSPNRTNFEPPISASTPTADRSPTEAEKMERIKMRLNFLKTKTLSPTLNVNAPAFEPNKNFLVPDDVKNDVDNVANIKQEPTNNDNLCAQYQQFNYCIQKNCDKIHKKQLNGELSKKMIKMYKEAFNQLNLPNPDDTVLVRVLSKIEGISFYGSLENTPFSIAGKNVTNYEFMKELNDEESTKNYIKPDDPNLIHKDDIILALCSDAKYHRAKVIDIYQTGFIVFQVDDGNTENVEFEDVRLIEPKLLDLPFQAIQMKLGGVSCAQQGKGEEFINAMVDNTFKAEIMERDNIGKTLTVKVFLPGYTNSVNDMLVDCGICVKPDASI